jgi:hypothetical protein
MPARKAQQPAEEQPPIVAGAPLVSSIDQLREEAQQTEKPTKKSTAKKSEGR